MSIIRCTLFSSDITISGLSLSSSKECPFCSTGTTKSGVQIDFTCELIMRREMIGFLVGCISIKRKDDKNYWKGDSLKQIMR